MSSLENERKSRTSWKNLEPDLSPESDTTQCGVSNVTVQGYNNVKSLKETRESCLSSSSVCLILKPPAALWFLITGCSSQEKKTSGCRVIKGTYWFVIRAAPSSLIIKRVSL